MIVTSYSRTLHLPPFHGIALASSAPGRMPGAENSGHTYSIGYVAVQRIVNDSTDCCGDKVLARGFRFAVVSAACITANPCRASVPGGLDAFGCASVSLRWRCADIGFLREIRCLPRGRSPGLANGNLILLKEKGPPAVPVH